MIDFKKMRPSFRADMIRLLKAEIEYAGKAEPEVATLLAELESAQEMGTEDWTTFSTKNLLRFALHQLNEIDDAGYFDHVLLSNSQRIDSRLVGALIRQTLPPENEAMTREQRLFWLEVNDHIGPDYTNLFKDGLPQLMSRAGKGERL